MSSTPTKFRYIPVISPTDFYYGADDMPNQFGMTEYGGQPSCVGLAAFKYLRDWHNQGFGPKLLAWKKKAEENNGCLFVDSSGFQTVTQGEEYNAKAVAMLQAQYGTVFPILDYPPYKPGAGAIIRSPNPLSFKKKLEMTSYNASIFAKLKDMGVFGNSKVYTVIQGRSFRERVAWREGLSSSEEAFDGVALAPEPPGEPAQVLSSLMFAVHQMNATHHLHLFAVSGFKAFCMLHAILKRRPDLYEITADSSTSIQLGTRLIYIRTNCDELWLAGQPRLFKLKQIDKKEGMQYIKECDCPVCTTIPPEKWFDGEDYIQMTLPSGEKLNAPKTALLVRHNHFAMLKGLTAFSQYDELTLLKGACRRVGVSLPRFRTAFDLLMRGDFERGEPLLRITPMSEHIK